MSQDDRMSLIERRYGIAGRAAGEAALMHGRDGARIRSCQDAFVLSRIARAVVDALEADDQEAVEALTAIEGGGTLNVLRHWECEFGHVHNDAPGDDCPRRDPDSGSWCGAPVAEYVTVLAARLAGAVAIHEASEEVIAAWDAMDGSEASRGALMGAFGTLRVALGGQ